LEEIGRLIDLEIINGEGKLRWDLGGSLPLYVQLTSEEKQLVREFLDQGRASLDGTTNR